MLNKASRGAFMELLEIYCSESELAWLLRSKRKKPTSVLRQLKAVTLEPQTLPSYVKTEFWDDDDTDEEAEQESQLLDYELAKAKAQLASVANWEKSVQRHRLAPLQQHNKKSSHHVSALAQRGMRE
jgi:hypothetical protein